MYKQEELGYVYNWKFVFYQVFFQWVFDIHLVCDVFQGTYPE